MATSITNLDTNQNVQTSAATGRKLCIGFIGTGGIAHSHLKSYLKFPDAEVVCGADLVPGKADALKKIRS